MIPPIVKSDTLPSLAEGCLEYILSNNLDAGCESSDLSLINRSAFSIWNDLYTQVPQNVLGLQTEMSDIKNKPDQSNAENPQSNAENPLESPYSEYFRKLTKLFSAEFKEAGINLNNRIPCSRSEYTRIQSILEEKWGDEALVTMWSNTGCDLSNALQKIGAFDNQSIPEHLQEVKIWLSESKNEVFLNQLIIIDLSELNIKNSPREISRFQHLQTLNLCSNKLRNFSCDLSPCKELKMLLLFNNKIQKFDPNLSCNSELECIELSKNRLQNFSADLKHCTNLRLVNLSFNQLIEFSCDLTNSLKLETLNLTFNNLQKFHYNLLPEKKPKHVLLSRNNIRFPNTPPGFRRTVRKLLAPPQQTEARTSPKPHRTKGAF